MSHLTTIGFKNNDGNSKVSMDIKGELTLKIIRKYLEDKKGITIGKNAFTSSSVITLDIGTNVTSIGERAFGGCRNINGTLIIPNTVEKIGTNAFRLCKFQGDLIIPDSVYKIGTYAFAKCCFNGKLKISEKIETICYGTFAKCSGFIGDLIIPNSVKSIGRNAFYGCEFTGKLILNQNIISSLTQKNGVISMNPFDGCNGLRVFSYDGTEQKINYVEKPIKADEKKIEADEKKIEADEKKIEADEKPIEADEKKIETDEKKIEADEKPNEADEKPIKANEKPIKADEKEIEADNETNSIKMINCSDISFDCNFEDIYGLKIHMNGCQNIKFAIN
jgi:hypothetical protein